MRVDGAHSVPIAERHGIQDQHLCRFAQHGDELVLASNRGLSIVAAARSADARARVHELIFGDRRLPFAEDITLPLGVRSPIVRLG